jgi:hypothetical protein
MLDEAREQMYVSTDEIGRIGYCCKRGSARIIWRNKKEEWDLLKRAEERAEERNKNVLVGRGESRESRETRMFWWERREQRKSRGEYRVGMVLVGIAGSIQRSR